VALTDDQKAMLRLLAQREEGYEDMAALMGISVEEVRARVKEALAEVDQSGAPAEPPAPPPEPPPPVAPEAEQTPPPAPQPTPEQAAAPLKPATPRRRPKRPSASPGLKLPKDRGALIGLGAGAIALIALALVLVLGGDGSGSSSGTTTGSEATSTPTSNSNLTEAVLTPTNGGDANGRALFGRFKKNVLLQVEAEGLDPAPSGQSYTIWLYRSPKIALRIGSVPERSGKIAAQLPIPAQLLSYVASGAFDQIDLSLTPDAAYKAALTKAKGEKTLPPFIGESVLRGEITGPAIKKQ
jgi:type IV secretory pathway VirB10-like protein